MLDRSQWLIENPILLIDEQQRITLPQFHAMFGHGPIAACDFRIEGIEVGESVAGGYLLNGVLNVDHHAPTLRMERHISSTHLAIAHVQTYGPVTPDWRVVINHTDTDSVLSSLILRGIIPPDETFAQAALAADHTGEENPIADFLQGSQHLRDLPLLARNLAYHLEGQGLDAAVQVGLEHRHADRQRANKLVASGAFKTMGALALATLDTKLDTGLLPSLLPKAAVILTFSPMRDQPSQMEAKVRLGLAAPLGTSLQRLDIRCFDPAFGGRWNAGSNKRGGGTTLSPEQYALRLEESLKAQGITGKPITAGGFRGDHAFLSNFYPCTLTFRGTTFRCSEAAYMAEKCCDPEARSAFAELDGPSAKNFGGSIQVRPDWDDLKLQAMRSVVAAKFEQNPDLAAKLIATADTELVEYNTWGDRFWGVCQGTGLNWLGRILMEQREAMSPTTLK